ncbi:MAG: FRG domain-containing protein [Acidobacteriaceae bacterium]
MQEMNVRTWEELVLKVADGRQLLDSAEEHDSSSVLLFRGQENSNWPLSTTLDRYRPKMQFQEYYSIISRIKSQIESLTDHSWSIPQTPEIDRLVRDYDRFSQELWAGERPWYAYMTYLRHHGFPSPLLDWTRSLYVAAYFAFARVSESENVSIFAYSALRLRVSGNNMRVVYRLGPHVKTHRRHVLQQSEYTMCVVSEEEESWFEAHDGAFDPGRHQQGFCFKFIIPSTERPKVLKVLDEPNLNAFSLFGSEDSLMEALATREFCFSPTTR